MILAAALAAQVALAPCTIEGVPGEARCGTHAVWEDRDAKQGRQIDLSIIVLPALEPNARPDPLFMLQGGPGDAPSLTARFYSRVFASVRVLYTPEGSARAPSQVRQLLGGDDRALSETALSGRTILGGERLAAGFFLSVTCAEDVPFLSRNADARAIGTFGGTYRLEQQRAACKEWTRGKVSAAHRQATTSAIPTLLISGELDPVTPPSGADESHARSLERPPCGDPQ